ncbi:50S ribosomal protein L21 [Desulfobotulus sp. H1]|uniref:Large ribosomal subunit protein bL21 n=1 Tax=Desulfobotulus pelophilus TaxID=2823377 RepID=A0ABT3NCG2_9BACT|nr:50S ribosomal protein L21 [Desulfobotulus pelophilus]MCW7755158.1 50S ribosomal protein L21 [Desulfobotulus pelophilus]
MTYAVVATGGKQYKVVEGETLRVEKIAGEVGAEVVLDSVLLVRVDDALKIGQPTLEGAAVHATIVEQDKAKKILVFKYKRRKRYRRMQGHRQPYTALRINRIDA